MGVVSNSLHVIQLIALVIHGSMRSTFFSPLTGRIGDKSVPLRRGLESLSILPGTHGPNWYSFLSGVSCSLSPLLSRGLSGTHSDTAWWQQSYMVLCYTVRRLLEVIGR